MCSGLGGRSEPAVFCDLAYWGSADVWFDSAQDSQGRVTIADSTFWFLFALSLVLMGVFRQIPFFFADLFSIESPANFVFVYVIAVLVIREFYATVEVSQLRAKVRNLVQKQALADAQERANTTPDANGAKEA